MHTLWNTLLLGTMLLLPAFTFAADNGRPEHIFGGRYTCNEDYPQCRHLNAQQEQIDRMREMRERMDQQRRAQERVYPAPPPQDYNQVYPPPSDRRRW